jgi:hypothetical protein
MKHDDKALYIALSITDNFLYGIQGPRWTPKANPGANEMGKNNRSGWPWFGQLLLFSQRPLAPFRLIDSENRCWALTP